MTLPAQRLASLPRRLACMFYESFLMLGVLAALIVPLVLFSAFGNTAVPIPFLRVYVVLGGALYFLWHWQGGRQTLAMRTWQLRIAAADGGHPSLLQLAWRYALAWPSIGLFGVGILWALADRDRQFLHDRLAGTRVIFVPPTTTSLPQPGET